MNLAPEFVFVIDQVLKQWKWYLEANIEYHLKMLLLPDIPDLYVILRLLKDDKDGVAYAILVSIHIGSFKSRRNWNRVISKSQFLPTTGN